MSEECNGDNSLVQHKCQSARPASDLWLHSFGPLLSAQALCDDSSEGVAQGVNRTINEIGETEGRKQIPV